MPPEVAMLAARPNFRSKYRATVVETSDGDSAANPIPPTTLNSATSCHGSVMNEHRIKAAPTSDMPAA